MKHLVVTVSAESSIELLRKHADVLILDQDVELNIQHPYESLYIRSHFSEPKLQPQNFRNEISRIVAQSKEKNPNIKVIDEMDTVEKIINFEDKWKQYQMFSEFVPRTQLLDEVESTDDRKMIYKKRLSSRGEGVTRDIRDVHGLANDWITQEMLDISEELRIYVVCGRVYPAGAVRRSMTNGQKTQAISARELTQDEVTFATMIYRRATNLDVVGLDVARTATGELRLMEVNRSPGFSVFATLTGVNIADLLYADPL